MIQKNARKQVAVEVQTAIPDEVDGSCSTGIERAKVQLSSTARKGVTQ